LNGLPAFAPLGGIHSFYQRNGLRLAWRERIISWEAIYGNIRRVALQASRIGLPFDEWTSVFAVFGSERLTGALLDRLTHHVSILTMNGDSYRLKQSARR
jgi:hypothetical protein